MSLEDYESDLTELSSSDEDLPIKPPKRKAPVRTPKTKEYALEDVLRAPRQTTYSAKALFDMMEQGFIYLDPPYQRSFVWTLDRQIALIDSVFTNVAIPQVILSNEQLKGGREKKTCIDGKQRLTSILRFFKGEIFFKHPQTGKRLWYTKEASSTKALLSKNQRQIFETKQISCIEYDALTPEQQREIFQRVQNGVALTAAERLRAVSSPRADLIRSLEKILGSGDFFQPLGWGKAMGRDTHCLVLTVYMCALQPKVRLVNIPMLEKWLQDGKDVTERFRVAMHETFEVLAALVRQEEFKGCFEKMPQFVFPFAGLLVFLNRARLSLGQLVSAVTGLRDVLRRRHGEAKVNGKVVKTLSNYVNQLNVGKLTGDGKGDIAAAVSIKSSGPVRTNESASAPRQAKRKRVALESDSEDDQPVVKRQPRKTQLAKAGSSTPATPAITTKKPSTPRIPSVPTPTIKAESISARKSSLPTMKIPKKPSTITAAAVPSPPLSSTRVKRRQPSSSAYLLACEPVLDSIILPPQLSELQHKAQRQLRPVPASRQPPTPTDDVPPPPPNPPTGRLAPIYDAKRGSSTRTGHLASTPPRPAQSVPPAIAASQSQPSTPIEEKSAVQSLQPAVSATTVRETPRRLKIFQSRSPPADEHRRSESAGGSSRTVNVNDPVIPDVALTPSENQPDVGFSGAQGTARPPVHTLPSFVPFDFRAHCSPHGQPDVDVDGSVALARSSGPGARTTAHPHPSYVPYDFGAHSPPLSYPHGGAPADTQSRPPVPVPLIQRYHFTEDD